MITEMEDIPKNKLLIGKILDSTMCQLVNGQRPKKETQELKLWSTRVEIVEHTKNLEPG